MKPGMRVAGRFEIEDFTITGGMATIHRARDLESNEVVAVKILSGRNVRDMERFSAEAVLLAELTHPGIVRYVAHGVLPDGDLYLAMQWLEGEDLSARLMRPQLLSISDAVRLASIVAAALGAAHARGIVHRDVKPSNIFLIEGRVDDVKLLDFGIARLGYGRTLATRTGTLLGTPGYMSPEQAQGRKEIDASADVFSLGAVLFECLTGRPAFTAEHLMATLSRILFEETPRVRTLRADVPPALDMLVSSMLAKDSSARPRDGSHVVEALEAIDYIPVDSVSFERSVPSIRTRQAITANEQQLLCVVLATASAAVTITDGAAAASNVTMTPEALADAQARFNLPSIIRDRQSSPGGGTLDDLRGVAAAYGGRVEWLVDGSMLAVFSGAPTAMDLAARAARAAISLRELLPTAALAVATGRGLAAEQMPVGEAVEAAARTLSSARRMIGDLTTKVFLDEVTAGLLDARFDVQNEGTLSVLVSTRDKIDVTRTVLGKPTPCVGREREITTLVGVFTEAIEEPCARAALVTGPAGIGKSRVATEVLRRLEGRATDMQVWIARGDPMAAGSSFGMLAQIVRAAAGIEVGAPAEVQEEKLTARVAECVRVEDMTRVVVFLGEMLGLRLPAERSHLLAVARTDAMLMGDQMCRAFEDWIYAECERHPVLLLLDDLHFGDLPTVRLIDAALRHARELPLGVLALARPEIARVFPRLWEERGVQEVRIGELGRRAVEQLIKGWLGPAADKDLVQRISDRAAGNPFFLEEIIRAVASGKTDQAMPGTVLAMVQARLEEIAPAERRTLRAAAIFGDVFWASGVAALVGGDSKVTAVKGSLVELVEREFVVRRSSRRFLEQEDFAFRNALVREAAYGMLTDGDRMLGHRLAAAWLESVGETEAMVLAQHYERGGDLHRAAQWFARAVDTALEGNDFAGVIERVERAVACGVHGEQLGHMRLRQAEAHRWRGEFVESEKRGIEAIHILAKGSDPWLIAVGEMSAVLGKLGNVERVVELSESMLEVSEDYVAPGNEGLLCALSRTSTAALMLSKSELAEALFGELERLAYGADSPLGEAWLHRARAFRAPYVSYPGSSGRHFALSADAFARAGDVRNACLQRANYGAACLEVGDWKAAEGALRPAIVEAERMGAKHIVSSAQRDLGYALARSGRVDEAKGLLEEAVAEFAAHGDRRLEGVGHDELSYILLLLGDLENAETHARSAVEGLSMAPAYLCHAQAALARILLTRGKIDEALEHARAGRALLTEVGVLEEGEGLIRLVLAQALHAAGKVDEARATLMDAANEVRRKAASITDADVQLLFLAIPEHIQTFELEKEWS
jgi:eukaryotic-like serine/threonine-protein kinase